MPTPYDEGRNETPLERELRERAARGSSNRDGWGSPAAAGGGPYLLTAMLLTAVQVAAAMAGRPSNDDEMRAYREGVWARREGQQLGGGGSSSSGGGGGAGGGGSYLIMSMLATVLTGLTAASQHPEQHGHRRAPDRAYMVGELASTVRTGLVTMRRAGPLGRSPRAASVAFIDWYQATQSAGRDLCPTGDVELHCSEYGRRAIERHGALIGWIRTAGRVHRCRRAQGFAF